MGDTPPLATDAPHSAILPPSPPPEEAITFDDGGQTHGDVHAEGDVHQLVEGDDGAEVGEMQGGEVGDGVEYDEIVDGDEIVEGGEVEYADGEEILESVEFAEGEEVFEGERLVQDEELGEDEHDGQEEGGEVLEELFQDEHGEHGEDYEDTEQHDQQDEMMDDGELEHAEEPTQDQSGEYDQEYELPDQEELAQDDLMEGGQGEHHEHDEDYQHAEHDEIVEGEHHEEGEDLQYEKEPVQDVIMVEEELRYDEEPEPDQHGEHGELDHDYEEPEHHEETTQDDLIEGGEPEHDEHHGEYQDPEHYGEDQQPQYEQEADQDGQPEHDQEYQDPEHDEIMEGEHHEEDGHPEYEEELGQDGELEQDGQEVLYEEPEQDDLMENDELNEQEVLDGNLELEQEQEQEELEELEEEPDHQEDPEVIEILDDEHGDPQQDEPDIQDGQQVLDEEAEQVELMDEFENLGNGHEQNEEPQQPDDMDLEELFNDQTEVDDVPDNVEDLDALMNDLQDNVEDPETQIEDLEDNPEGPQSQMEGIQTTSYRQDNYRAAAMIPDVPSMPESLYEASTAQNQLNDQVVGEEDGDSLFMPYDRLPSPPPNFFTKPSKSSRRSGKSSRRAGKSARPPERPATPGLSSRPAQPSILPSKPSGLPRDNNRPSDYNPLARPHTMTPPTIPAKPPASLFARIRDMQQKKEQSKLAAAKAPSSAGPSSAQQPSYLDRILSRQPDRQQSVDAILATDPDNDNKINAAARAKFQKDKNHYDSLRRSNGGKLTFADEVAWMRINTAEETRLRKRKRDMEMDSQGNGGARTRPGPPLFGNPNNLDNWNEDVQTNFGEGPSSSQPPSAPSPGRVFQSMVDAEIQSMQVALQSEGDARPKKRKKTAGKSKEVKDTRERTKAGGRKSAKEKKDAENASRMQSSLLFSDVFRQQADEDAPEQPTFKARNKADALKELIASVPIEHQKTARDDTAALLRATKDFDGRGSCKADGNGMWKIKGMSTSLKHYQVMGTAFMRRRENDQYEPRGGLMADQMGLGKTLMTMANIINGQGNDDQECKTTLLVASPALIKQWQREIDLHAEENRVEYMTYASGINDGSRRMAQFLKQHDIVFTTYHEVCQSYPKNDPPIECQTAEQKIEWWRNVYEQHRGLLHRMMFHRIVLDEAQSIKNHLSRTSLACRALMARHKWALSGTPILNGLDELYSYFKFLNVPHTGSFKIFKHNYTDPKEPESIERLLVRLSQFMIRRDHSDKMMGVPILKLPRASQMTHWTEFNSVERSVYEVVRQRFAKRINFSSRRGELDKQYNNALVMLLRLRQLTAHILMLQFVVQDLLEQEDIEKIREIVQQQATDQRSRKGNTIRAIRRQLDHLEAEAKKRSSKKAANHPREFMPMVADYDIADDDQGDVEELLDDDQDPDIDGGTGRLSAGRTFGKKFDFRPFLNSLAVGENWEKVKLRAECNGCGLRPTNAWVTSCGHIHCGKCYEDAGMEAAENGRMHATCLGCGSVFAHANHVGAVEGDGMFNGRITRAREKHHSKETQRIEQQDIAEDWLSFSGSVLPSAKTIALKAQIMNWLSEDSEVKIIIYTQFLAMIRIMKKMCEEEHWMTQEYHGKMSQRSRDESIQRFADGNASIMLASLRCGGLGLNLTMASRVVILDPWWNSAAEQQAFCRVFRFGQTRQTLLTRFCVKNTVDERLIEMQERKQKEIDAVMNDDLPGRVGKMDTRDLMRLFGYVRDDENGRPYILVDDPDPSVRVHADEVFEDDM